MIDHLVGATAVAPRAGASVDASVHVLDASSVIKTFGLAGIFVIPFVETGLLIGFFLPGDTLLALAGAFAALPVSDSRHLPLAALLVGCPIAAIAGGQVGFTIGRRSVASAKPGSSFEHSLRRIEPLFERFGEGWAVLLCRFIPVLRAFLNPAAGSEPVGALEVPGTKVVSHDGIQAVLAPTGSSTPEDAVRALISRFPVVNIGVVETNLEDVMRDVYLSTLDEQNGDELNGDQRAVETSTDRRPA